VETLNFHVGPNANQTITTELRAVQASTLNLHAVDVEGNPQYSVSFFDAATDAVAAEQAGTAIAAQANMLPQTLLALLGLWAGPSSRGCVITPARGPRAPGP
jgi:hypothetical protein